jgi:hypothetical protein
MTGYQVQHAALSDAGKVVGKLPSELTATQSTVDTAVQAGTATVPGYALSAALRAYRQQAQAALRSIGRAIEDHGGGLVNNASNYDNNERTASWMFKRVKSELGS